MSTHCPTCGASDDGTANGWQHRAQAAEAELDRTRRPVRAAGALRIYIAAPFKEQVLARGVMRQLEAHGYEITSTWLKEDDQLDDATARLDLADVARADVLLALNPQGYANSGTGGRHIEFGYALALGKQIVLVGDRTNLFHHLSSVYKVQIEGLLPVLESLKGEVARGA